MANAHISLLRTSFSHRRIGKLVKNALPLGDPKGKTKAGLLPTGGELSVLELPMIRFDNQYKLIIGSFDRMTDPFTAATTISQVITGFIGIKEQLKDADLKIAMAEHIDRLQSFGMTNLYLVEKNSELQAMNLKLTKDIAQATEKLEEKNKYRLKETLLGKFIYVLNVEKISSEHKAEQTTETSHAVCPDCFKGGRIRILQKRTRRTNLRNDDRTSLLECQCGVSFQLNDAELKTIYD